MKKKKKKKLSLLSVNPEGLLVYIKLSYCFSSLAEIFGLHEH